MQPLLILRYGRELNLGAREFADLDEIGTALRWTAMVEQHLQDMLPEMVVTSSYNPDEEIARQDRITIEGIADMDEENAIRAAVALVENAAIAGDYGEYAVKLGEEPLP